MMNLAHYQLFTSTIHSLSQYLNKPVDYDHHHHQNTFTLIQRLNDDDDNDNDNRKMTEVIDGNGKG